MKVRLAGFLLSAAVGNMNLDRALHVINAGTISATGLTAIGIRSLRPGGLIDNSGSIFGGVNMYGNMSRLRNTGLIDATSAGVAGGMRRTGGLAIDFGASAGSRNGQPCRFYQ